ncbi:MAG: hypothetical protein AB1760_17935, partial [Pseudomonadota bacterium]
SSEGALAPDEPEPEEEGKVVEMVQAEAEETAGAAEEAAEETMESAEEAWGAAQGSMQQTGAGMMGRLRSKAKLAAWAGGALAAMTALWMWRRGRRARRLASLTESGESVLARFRDLASQAADMLAETSEEVRNRAVDQLEDQLERMRRK